MMSNERDFITSHVRNKRTTFGEGKINRVANIERRHTNKRDREREKEEESEVVSLDASIHEQQILGEKRSYKDS